MSSYPKPKTGEWIEPHPSGYKMRCCDCKLVHVLKFRVYSDGTLEMNVERDNRSTAASRRRKAK